MSQHIINDFVELIEKDSSLSEQEKAIVFTNLARTKDTKVNILITGATGCGKSSTINALFDTNKAKVGMGVDPETMEIQKYELDNLVLYDSPGLGDGKEADIRHAKNIIELLYQKDANGELLIDLVLVILDGGSRDLGTSFELINNVIIPNLGTDKKRLLVAINQCDTAMKGRNWNSETNEPEAPLIQFLDEKVISTQRRIKEATNVDVTPVYYSAGYQDDFGGQKPYNLSKLLLFILRHTKEEKRIVIAQDMNRNSTMWEKDDQIENYQKEIKSSFLESVKVAASHGADIGGKIGSIFGGVGETVGRVVGGVVGGAFGAIASFFGF